MSPKQNEAEVPARVTRWLMQGDPAIRWQTMRDILGASSTDVEKERRRMAAEGWGARLLGKQNPDGHWGRGFYQPKWTCTTYTMQLLRRLGMPPDHPGPVKACRLYLEQGIGADGGINFWQKQRAASETCVTGMVLSQLAYFLPRERALTGIVDHLLREQMVDGGWNCQRPTGAVHSSFHTTTSVLEGLQEYVTAGGSRAAKAKRAAARGREFLLQHNLFKSSRTAKVVDAKMTRFYFPPRWHHDVLRSLDYFRSAGAPPDPRLSEAVDFILKRRSKDGRWSVPAAYKGAVFFQLERAGKPSRCNTLRALRVLAWFNGE